MSRNRRNSGNWDVASIVLVTILALGAINALKSHVGSVIATPTASSVPSATTPDAKAMLAKLNALKTLSSEPNTPGYQRGCGAGQACSFGAAWSDNTSAPDGHNGCGTRDDVLREQMSDVKLKSGSRCIVVAGALNDPYTGKTIHFAKADASAVQIDHIAPLAYVWRLGANTWTQAQRNAYANDTATVLLAVDGPANEAKGDSGPSQWMPANKAFACTYATKFTAVLVKYQLPVPAADKAALIRAFATC
ncbi:HNH endonuclease family protein [Branchiibius sp. NY16-3462-2]|uniref:HNH endonuclease family protein n=1 Tax=Branchiibius sp. NY16-3462-2 TaxID=1807500 RepID=UPI00079783C1|nr:HNH endonuclease family protein [Branchiibius sp. NY16-3462-2]KYH44778.1 hypothetical protein AZH51_12185 [Branchiibius sp. NY16-3462-2]